MGRPPLRQSLIYARVVAALQQGARTVRDTARAAYTCEGHAKKILNDLHGLKQIHIARWQRSASGPFAPIYRWGAGADAKKPAPYSASELCKRYRKSMKEKFGPDYTAVRRLQNQKVPGRKLILDGQVAYQQ